MNASGWTTPAAFFPWPHVQKALDESDPQVYRAAMRAAREQLGGSAQACAGCGRPPEELTWLGISSPDEAWERGEGQAGFLTVCARCRWQVDFFKDDELTEIEEEARRDGGDIR